MILKSRTYSSFRIQFVFSLLTLDFGIYILNMRALIGYYLSVVISTAFYNSPCILQYVLSTMDGVFYTKSAYTLPPLPSIFRDN
jgi:hypothetical protein